MIDKTEDYKLQQNTKAFVVIGNSDERNSFASVKTLLKQIQQFSC